MPDHLITLLAFLLLQHSPRTKIPTRINLPLFASSGMYVRRC